MQQRQKNSIPISVREDKSNNSSNFIDYSIGHRKYIKNKAPSFSKSKKKSSFISLPDLSPGPAAFKFSKFDVIAHAMRFDGYSQRSSSVAQTVPGVGSYESLPRLPSQNKSSFFQSKTHRFKTSLDNGSGNVTGPGQYEISTKLQGNGKTFPKSLRSVTQIDLTNPSIGIYDVPNYFRAYSFRKYDQNPLISLYVSKPRIQIQNQVHPSQDFYDKDYRSIQSQMISFTKASRNLNFTPKISTERSYHQDKNLDSLLAYRRKQNEQKEESVQNQRQIIKDQIKSARNTKLNQYLKNGMQMSKVDIDKLIESKLSLLQFEHAILPCSNSYNIKQTNSKIGINFKRTDRVINFQGGFNLISKDHTPGPVYNLPPQKQIGGFTSKLKRHDNFKSLNENPGAGQYQQKSDFDKYQKNLSKQGKKQKNYFKNQNNDASDPDQDVDKDQFDF